ncbi:hypothetical protein MTO96_005713 [Rhipicephalus appendiculatus]
MRSNFVVLRCIVHKLDDSDTNNLLVTKERPKKSLASCRVKRSWSSLERYRDNRHVGTRAHFEAKSASIDFNEPTKFVGGVYCEQLNVAETLLPGTASCSEVSSLVA